jgi:hypothetical protein
MGSNFLALGIGGALSGLFYTSIYGKFCNMNNPEYIWFILATHLIVGIIAISIN